MTNKTHKKSSRICDCALTPILIGIIFSVYKQNGVESAKSRINFFCYFCRRKVWTTRTRWERRWSCMFTISPRAWRPRCPGFLSVSMHEIPGLAHKKFFIKIHELYEFYEKNLRILYIFMETFTLVGGQVFLNFISTEMFNIFGYFLDLFLSSIQRVADDWFLPFTINTRERERGEEKEDFIRMNRLSRYKH